MTGGRGCLLLAIVLAGGLLAGGLLAGCQVAVPAGRPASPLELRYRMRHLPAADRDPGTSTSVYRGVLARSMYSDCRMRPSDSVAYAERLRRCGITRAVFTAAARLLLERAATPAYLRPVRHDGKLRWMDLPAPGTCAP